MTTSTYRLRTVDVFTDTALAGNPLAVILDADGLSEVAMQRVAREMNLSETTFVHRPERGGTARVRIFTPYAELPFAGHPTVGTAWVLLDEGRVPDSAQGIVLEERVGPVPVRVERNALSLVLWMTHPPVQFGDIVAERAQVAAAIGLEESDLMPELPLQVASTGVAFLYVALRDSAAVDAATPNGERLDQALRRYGSPAVFVFARQDNRRLYSRMFGAHSLTQIVEDPATGSASGPLGAVAVRHGLIPRAASVEIVSEQGTKMGRQSFVHIKLAYDNGAEVPRLIEVGGSVVPALTGTLSI